MLSGCAQGRYDGAASAAFRHGRVSGLVFACRLTRKAERALVSARTARVWCGSFWATFGSHGRLIAVCVGELVRHFVGVPGDHFVSCLQELRDALRPRGMSA